MLDFRVDLTDGSGQIGLSLCSEKQVCEIICIVKMKNEGRNSVAYSVESMKTHQIMFY